MSNVGLCGIDTVLTPVQEPGNYSKRTGVSSYIPLFDKDNDLCIIFQRANYCYIKRVANYDSQIAENNMMGKDNRIVIYDAQLLDAIVDNYSRIVVKAKLLTLGSVSDGKTCFIRFTHDDVLDTTFGRRGFADIFSWDSCSRLCPQIVGDPTDYNNNLRVCDLKRRLLLGRSSPLDTLWRYSIICTIDSTFGSNGRLAFPMPNMIQTQIHFDSMNNIFIAGSEKHLTPKPASNGDEEEHICDEYMPVIYKFTETGVPDKTFGTVGKLLFVESKKTCEPHDISIASASNGKMYFLAGDNSDGYIWCIKSDGTLDQSFHNSGVLHIKDSIFVQSYRTKRKLLVKDGKVYVLRSGTCGLIMERFYNQIYK